MGNDLGKMPKRKYTDDEAKHEDMEQLSMLTNFTSKELMEVHNEFKKESPSGQLDRKQFDKFYSRLFKQDKDKHFVDHLFRTFDFNNDGQINFKEFVCGISITTRGTLDEKLRWTFNVYDVNQDGTITNDEMGEIMRAIYAINGVSEPEQIKSGSEAFQGLDLNGDGLITVAEFVKGIKRDKRLLEMLERTVSGNSIPRKK